MGTPWTVPRLWPGETVAIAATGPSLTVAQLEAVRGRCRLIVVNDAYKLAPWADLLYACDVNWWLHHQNAPGFAGLKVSCVADVDFRDVMIVPQSGRDGFDPDPGAIRTGENGGYQALHLAAHLGAAKVLLLGFDMGRDAHGRAHFFGEHPAALRRESPYTQFARNFATLVEPMKERGIEVLNCTPGSALTCFPTACLEEALA